MIVMMRKNILFLLACVLVVVTGCDPMKDTYNELDSIPNVQPFSITLKDPQYKLLPSSSPASKQLYFSTETEAKENIPTILNILYPEYSEGASATVNYTVAGNVISSRASYTLTTDDYTALGFANSRINITNGDNDIRAFLNYKFPIPVENQLVIITYTAYNSNVSTTAFPVTDSFYFINGKWFNAYHVVPADYASNNSGRFNNYTSADKPYLGDYFNRFLLANVSGAKQNDIMYVSYYIFDNSTTPSVTEQRIMTMYFDGIRWKPVVSNEVVTSSQGFVKLKETWIVDPTINYTLVTADYLTIGDIASVGTTANRANLKSFKNFNISPSGSTVWKDEEVTAALAQFLKIKFPNTEVDAQYRITYYAYRSGIYSYPTKTYKKTSSGEFELVIK